MASQKDQFRCRALVRPESGGWPAQGAEVPLRSETKGQAGALPGADTGHPMQSAGRSRVVLNGSGRPHSGRSTLTTWD
jgi:hypothetical protein